MRQNKLRYYPIKPVFNYGALPMTWEDPKRKAEEGEFYGDCDPIDVVEISGKQLIRYEVYRVRVIGCFKLIDSGEVDWKVLAIDVNSDLNAKIKNITDFRQKMPDRYHEIKDWFKNYKTY